MTPASSTIVVSSQDTAIMFIPNSPRPPRGTTTTVAGACSGIAVDVIRRPVFDRGQIEPRHAHLGTLDPSAFSVHDPRAGTLARPGAAVRAGLAAAARSGDWDRPKTRMGQRLRGTTIAQPAPAPRSRRGSDPPGALQDRGPHARSAPPDSGPADPRPGAARSEASCAVG